MLLPLHMYMAHALDHQAIQASSPVVAASVAAYRGITLVLAFVPAYGPTPCIIMHNNIHVST